MAQAKSGWSDKVSLALRIATMALSAASAVTMFSATGQPTAGGSGAPASNVSYSDYSSLSYSFFANVISVLLQAAAAYLKVSGKEKEAEAFKSLAELIDIASQVLLSSSSGLSFSVDDFGSCGRRLTSVCKSGGEFCPRVRASGAISLSAAVTLAVSLYIKDVPVSISLKEDEEPCCGRGDHCHH